MIQAQYDNPALKFVVPEEGVHLWSDNMMVPNQATHQENAEKWIDFYYRPDVAAKLASWVNYICPVDGAREEMEKIDPSLVDNPLIFPDDDMLEQHVRVPGARRPGAASLRRRVVGCHHRLRRPPRPGRRRGRRTTGCG